MTDKIILTVIARMAYFGLIGLISPVYIATLLDMQLSPSIGYSELRAMYAFCVHGFNCSIEFMECKT